MKRVVTLVLAFGVIGLIPSSQTSQAIGQIQTGAAGAKDSRPNVYILAHRGDSKVAPENTLPSFESAIRAGADFVELDYFQSSDGVPVAIHDATLDRTTNARALWGGEKIRVNSKTIAELQQLDAGSWFDAKFAGTRLPTLVEALTLIKPPVRAFVECKSGDPTTCVAVLKQMNMLDTAIVQSFDWLFLAECRRLDPKMLLAALGDRELTDEKLDQIDKIGVQCVAWESRGLNAERITAIHARGHQAVVWTVDEPQRIRELVDDKIDGIITNRPAATRAVVDEALKAR